MKRTGILLLLIGIHFTLSAQDTLNLEEAVAIALQNNFQIRIAETEQDISDNNARYINAAFLPNLNAGVTRNNTRRNLNQQFLDGRQNEVRGARGNQLNGNISLNWLLFDGLRMFATRERILELQALGEINLKNSIQNTVYNVITTYYSVVREQQQLKATLEQMEISNERLKLAEARFQTGLGSNVDVLQAKVDMNEQKAAYLQQQTLIAQNKTSLNQLLNLPLDLNVSVRDSIPVSPDLQMDEIQTVALQNNINIQETRKFRDLARISVREVKADRFPQLEFNSNYNFSRNNSPGEFLQQSRNSGLLFGFTLSVPILNNFDIKRQIENARIDVRRWDLRLDSQRIFLNATISNAFKEYQFQLQALALEEENLGLAKENVEVALARFKQGLSTTLEVKQAQVSLEDAYNRLIAARYNTKVAETDLLLEKGELVRAR